MTTMTKQARKKIWALLALGTFTGLLLLPLFLSFPTGASGETAPADSPAKPGEKTRDVWYRNEGPVMGAPAPKTTAGPKDYHRYNFVSSVNLWVGLQQQLYYG